MLLRIRQLFAIPGGLETASGPIERMLAGPRAAFTVGALLAIYFDPTQPTHPALTYGLLIAYVAYSFAVFAAVRRRDVVPNSTALAIHTTDLVAAVILGVFAQGPTSPCFALFGFLLLQAAYRWGLWETVATAAMSVALVGLGAVLVTTARFSLRSADGDFDLNRVVLGSAYLGLAVVVGGLAEYEKRSRAELAWLAGVSARAQQARGFVATLRVLGTALLSAYRSKRVSVITEERGGRTFLWSIDNHQAGVRRGMNADATIQMTELDEALCASYALPEGMRSGLISRHNVDEPWVLRTLDASQRRLSDPLIMHTLRVLQDERFTHALVVTQSYDESWRSRLFLFDPVVGRRVAPALRRLQSLTTQLAPIAFRAYSIGRVRSRATATERGRLARELHDGVVQSLIGLQMQIEAFQSRQLSASQAVNELARVRDVLGQEVIHLRMMVFGRMSTQEPAASLAGTFAEILERFEHASGISSRLVAHGEGRSASARVSQQLGKILQEGLVNVQRHSGARQVVVSLNPRDSGWFIAIEDDGRGFDFEGRLSQDELDRTRRGPRVINERVRVLGGSVAVESKRGRGARIEIVVPMST
jgi:signal transduction histidine kinase